jgi:ATP adenylyltransferase
VTGQARSTTEGKDDCVFCQALKLGPGAESLILTQDDLAFTVLNKYPYNPAHLLVLPTRHIADLTDLTKDELLAIQLQIQTGLQIVRQVYSPAAFNLGVNLGRAAGAGLPGHLHHHVVPRWSGDTNFFPLMSGAKVVSESLEQTFSRLWAVYQNGNKK